MAIKVRKGDTVMVIAGDDKGKTGRVLSVDVDKQRVIVEKINFVKRHTKARSQTQQGGILEKEAPIHLSNLMILCDRCNAPVRIGKRLLEAGAGEKARSVRVCRRCDEQLDR